MSGHEKVNILLVDDQPAKLLSYEVILGELGEMIRRFPILVKEAHDRGDRLAEANYTTFGGPFVWLAADDPEGAREAQANVMGDWSKQEIALDAARLPDYVGQYQFDFGAVLDVRLNDGKLKAQLTGQHSFPIFASAPDDFFYKVVEAAGFEPTAPSSQS